MKQIGKASCYFILYLFGQFVIGYMVQFLIGMQAGAEIKAAGLQLTQEETIAYANNYYASRMWIDLAVRAIFTLVFLIAFFAIRRKNIAKELDLKKIPAAKSLAAALGALFVIFTVNMSMGFLPSESVEEFTEASQNLYAYSLWQAFLTNAFLVPVLEEVIFRGVLFSRLQKVMPNVVVALITSVLFGLMHGQIIWILFAFTVGLLLSYVRIKTGSIQPTIMMHVLINSYAVIVNYKLFTIESNAVAITLMIVGVLGLACCIFLMTKACKAEKENPAKIEVSTIVM